MKRNDYCGECTSKASCEDINALDRLLHATLVKEASGLLLKDVNTGRVADVFMGSSPHMTVAGDEATEAADGKAGILFRAAVMLAKRSSRVLRISEAKVSNSASFVASAALRVFSRRILTGATLKSRLVAYSLTFSYFERRNCLVDSAA